MVKNNVKNAPSRNDLQKRETKVIHAAKYVKSSSEDLHREVFALFSLRKSSLILQFVAFYSNPTTVQSVLVTEFLAGGDLCERTSAKDYVLTEHKCRTIVRQICRGKCPTRKKPNIIVTSPYFPFDYFK
jgi:serine/threonine protein kinase